MTNKVVHILIKLNIFFANSHKNAQYGCHYEYVCILSAS